MSFRSSRFLALPCLLALLTSCAGQSAAPLPATVAGAPAADRPGSSLRPPQHRRKGTLTVRIRIPKRHQRHDGRAPRYISAATKGMTMAFTGPTTMTQVVNLTPSDPRCSGSPLTCTIAVTLLAGSYTVTINTYDRAPAGGRIPAGANLLSSAKNAPFTMIGGITNNIGITLDGVPASLAVSGLPSGTIGTPTAATPFAVTVKDAAGDIITGTYDNAVTLANNDHSGATTVVTSGSDGPPAGKLLSSSDVATLAYTGASLDSATVTASATGATSGNASFAPLPTLASIGTGSGLIGTSTSETLTGNFVAGATTVNVSGTGVTVRNVVATNTTITASFFVDPETSTGARNVSVQTTAGASSSTSQTFTIGNTGVDVVTLATDTALGATPGLCASAGNPGDLRHALCNASAGDTIVFDTTAICGGSVPCTIALGAPLPPIVANQTIDGGYFGRIIVDGASSYRVFFVDTGTVTLANLQIQNATAQGGAGAPSGGGGGLGAGAGLFVNKAGASVTVDSVYFLGCGAGGGAGDGGWVGSGGGGGGGLASAGGSWLAPSGGSSGGAGGGGVLSAGAPPNTNDGGNGGEGGGGGGSGVSGGGTGGIGYATNPAGSNGLGGAATPGGSGGFGGGGGGGTGDHPGGAGGAGGFGGGGGGGGVGSSAGALGGTGGAGGPGAGGGGGGNAEAGTGGVGGAGGVLATIHGGAGGDAVSTLGGAGGGGAAAGPAIFVNAGTVTTINSGATGSSAIGGSAGGGNATAGGNDATPVFNYQGTVNGVPYTTAQGGIASALSSTTPSLKHRAQQRRKPRRA